MLKKYYIMACLMLFTCHVFAFSMHVDHASLSRIIRMMAHAAKINVMLSPAVTGTATLALEQTSIQHALQTLLITHGLTKWQEGDIWYIAPQDEVIQRKQKQVKWQALYRQAAPLKTRLYHIRYAKADDIGHILQHSATSFMTKRGQIQVDLRTNSLLIKDVQANMVTLTRLIKELDVPVKQIMIKAKLVSIDSDEERELGLSFNVVSKQKSSEKGMLSSVAKAVSGYSLAVASLADGNDLDVRLAALETNGHAKLISSPRLFTASQQSASIAAGEEVPYQEVSKSGGTAVAFKKAVLGLTVTPQILPDNRVLMKLQINQDRPSARLVRGVPAISTRQMLTNLVVKNGETVVLGGIYETNEEGGERRIPLLADIPFIGSLFQHHQKRHGKRELLIFVTPVIMS